MRAARVFVGVAFGLALPVAPVPVRAAFERISTGPAAAGAGEIAALAEDPVFGNPASLTRRLGIVAELWGARPFGLPELRESQASLGLLFGRGSVGAGFREFGSVDYFEREARVAASFAPTRRASRSRETPPFALGFAARVLAVGGPVFRMRTAACANLALRARLDDSTELAVLLESILGGVPGDPGRRLPRSSFAAARDLPFHSRLLVEVGRRADRAPRVAAGLTLEPHSALVLRAGARADPASLSWGISLRASGGIVSCSSTETQSLGRTVRVGIGWEPRIAQDATSSADP